MRLAALVREVDLEVKALKKVYMLGAGERGIPRAGDADALQIVKPLLVLMITLICLAALPSRGSRGGSSQRLALL